MRQLLQSIVFLVFLNSCNEVSDSPNKVSQIIQERVSNIETIEDLFTIKEIDLITNGKTSLHKAEPNFTVDNLGNIYFKGGSNEIYKFDGNGNYIGELRKVGRGPGEYISINSFYVDEKQNIYVDNASAKAILKYDENFNYVDKIEKESFFPLIQIEKYEENLLGYAPGRSSSPMFLYDLNKMTQIDEMGIENSDIRKYGMVMFGGNFDVFNNKIYYNFPEQYQIFVIDNGQTYKLLNTVPTYFAAQKNKDKNLSRIKGRKIPLVYQVIVEKDFIILCYTTDIFGEPRDVLFDVFTLSGEILKRKVPAKLEQNFRKYTPGKYIAFKTFYSKEEDYKIKVYLYELKK